MIRIEDYDSAITVAQKIIHGTRKVEMTPARKIGVVIATGKAPEEGIMYDEDMFSSDEIREIGEYLLTYHKFHGGGYEED